MMLWGRRPGYNCPVVADAGGGEGPIVALVLRAVDQLCWSACNDLFQAGTALPAGEGSGARNVAPCSKDSSGLFSRPEGSNEDNAVWVWFYIPHLGVEGLCRLAGLALLVGQSCSITLRNYYDEILTRRVCLGKGPLGPRGQQCLCEEARVLGEARS